MIQHGQDLALVLDMVDLLRLQDFDLLQNFGCVELVGLPMLDQSDSAEGALLQI